MSYLRRRRVDGRTAAAAGDGADRAGKNWIGGFLRIRRVPAPQAAVRKGAEALRMVSGVASDPARTPQAAGASLAAAEIDAGESLQLLFTPRALRRRARLRKPGV